MFLYNAAYLILKGLFWGNLIGISLLLIQHYFGIITLDPSTYYVAKVPVSFSVLAICFIKLRNINFMFYDVNNSFLYYYKNPSIKIH